MLLWGVCQRCEFVLQVYRAELHVWSAAGWCVGFKMTVLMLPWMILCTLLLVNCCPVGQVAELCTVVVNAWACTHGSGLTLLVTTDVVRDPACLALGMSFQRTAFVCQSNLPRALLACQINANVLACPRPSVAPLHTDGRLSCRWLCC